MYVISYRFPSRDLCLIFSFSVPLQTFIPSYNIIIFIPFILKEEENSKGLIQTTDFVFKIVTGYIKSYVHLFYKYNNYSLPFPYIYFRSKDLKWTWPFYSYGHLKLFNTYIMDFVDEFFDESLCMTFCDLYLYPKIFTSCLDISRSFFFFDLNNEWYHSLSIWPICVKETRFVS